jgi:methyl-accepting chemotaxis protein
MKTRSLGFRMLASTLLLVTICCGFFGIFTCYYFSVRTHREAKSEVAREFSQVAAHISSIDTLTRAQVRTAMRVLQQQSALKGQPSIKGTATLSGVSVPNLYFGTESQVGNFAVVDNVKTLAGVSATFFAFDGTKFIRVSTNVMKPDGSRAVATSLDASGPAYAALAHGQPFEGVADILGVSYITNYTPMRDGAGQIVGAWYSGYRLDSIAAVLKNIEDARILDHGFVALVKSSGTVLAHSQTISTQDLDRILNKPDGWQVQRSALPEWNCSVVIAYPTSDVNWRTIGTLEVLTGETVVLVGLIFLLQFILLNRLVVRPVGNLASHLDNADLNTVLDTAGCDEIGDLSASVNRFVDRIRQTLLHVHDRAAATSRKSDEIREISHQSVAGMVQQQEQAEGATAIVTELCREIASTSNHTDEASVQARAAADAARQGGELVAATASKIQQLAQDTHESATRIASLSDRAQQIGSIVGVIEEIAAGTNLLALNASIEAARAGEHGRGFAVVAGEVRRLAERTAQATREVASLVTGIQQETGLATSDIDAACTHANEGAQAVSGLNDTFERIAKIVFEVDGRIATIAEAARHEAHAADSATASMNAVATSARESAHGAKKVVEASSELLEIGRMLAEIVQQFNVEGVARKAA